MNRQVEWYIGGTRALALASRQHPTFVRGKGVSLEFRFDDKVAYEEVRDRVEWAGTYYLNTTIDGEPFVREFLSDRAPFETNIVLFQSGTDITRIPDFWAAITGGQDTSEQPGVNRLSVDVTMLARGREYDDYRGILLDMSTPISQL